MNPFKLLKQFRQRKFLSLRKIFTWLLRANMNKLVSSPLKKRTRTVKEERWRERERENENIARSGVARGVAKERTYTCLHETQISKIYKIRSKTSSLPDCITLCHKRQARGETDVLLSLRLARIVLFRGFIIVQYTIIKIAMGFKIQLQSPCIQRGST